MTGQLPNDVGRSMNAAIGNVRALPGLWREFGDGPILLRLAAPAATPGMVLVAPAGSAWQRRPALRWQAWPDELKQVLEVAA